MLAFAGVPHRSDHSGPDQPLDRADAEQLAEAMRAFGSATRLQLLWSLLDGERTVEELVDAVDLEQSSVSHQLRLLRGQRLVVVRRAGRHAYYRLHDHHLPELLLALRHHLEHATTQPAEPSRAAPEITA